MLPPSQIEAEPARLFPAFDSPEQWEYAPIRLLNLAVAGPDQLRLRVSWALSQLLVVSRTRVSSYAAVVYFNLLQRHALGNYRELLKAIAVSSVMGFFLDSAENVRQGAGPGLAPNENFARELMQLFTIGQVMLHLDGTPRLDQNGTVIATYDQKIVEATARALSGWFYAGWEPENPAVDFAGFALPMIERWPNRHDTGEKQIIGGRTIAAGGSADSDLDAVLDALMAHPNVAPFVSHKLIQHLVSGDPSPAYVARVAGSSARAEGT